MEDIEPIDAVEFTDLKLWGLELEQLRSAVIFARAHGWKEGNQYHYPVSVTATPHEDAEG